MTDVLPEWAEVGERARAYWSTMNRYGDPLPAPLPTLISAACGDNWHNGCKGLARDEYGYRGCSCQCHEGVTT